MTLPNVIILEGCDGGGKTTLANRLRDELGYCIVKTGPPVVGEDTLTSYMAALLVAHSGGDKTVFDRHYLGETIYGPLLRGVDTLGPVKRAAIERVIETCGARMIICCPPWDVLVAGWRSKDDLLTRVEQLRHVHDRYLEEAERLGLRIYDWTASDAEETLKGLIEA